MGLISLLSPARLVAALQRMLRPSGGGSGYSAALTPLPPPPSADEVAFGGTLSGRPAPVSRMRSAILENSDAVSAIRLISEEIGSRPVLFGYYDGDEWVSVERHVVLDMMRRHVQSYTLAEYVKQSVSEALIAGEALSELRGRPSRLVPSLGKILSHDPADVRTHTAADDLSVLSYEVCTPDRTYYVPPEQMVHWRLNPILGGSARFTGVSPFYPLLRRMDAAREDEEYLQQAPRNAPRNLLVEIDPSAEGMTPQALAGKVQAMARIRDRTSYNVALQGLKLSAMAVDNRTDDLEARQQRVSEMVTLALDLAPVLRNQSVTNDSAAAQQFAHFRRMLHWMAADLWAAHQTLIDLYLTPEERLLGYCLRSDWSGDEQDADLANKERRAALLKTYTDAGVPLVQAAELAGVPLDNGADNGAEDDRAREPSPGLRVVAGSPGGR